MSWKAYSQSCDCFVVVDQTVKMNAGHVHLSSMASVTTAFPFKQLFIY